MENKKMIVTDLDGTLLKENKTGINASEKYLLELRNKGYIIAIATGRTLDSAIRATVGAEFANYIISDAGGRVHDMQSDTDRFLFGYNIFERIAKEGRKYGVILGLISQRPVEISDTVISQCTNFLIFKINHPVDVEYIRKMVPNITDEIVEKQKSLQSGTCLGFGLGFKIPLIIKMEMPNPSPLSSNCDVVNIWNGSSASGNNCMDNSGVGVIMPSSPTTVSNALNVSTEQKPMQNSFVLEIPKIEIPHDKVTDSEGSVGGSQGLTNTNLVSTSIPDTNVIKETSEKFDDSFVINSSAKPTFINPNILDNQNLSGQVGVAVSSSDVVAPSLVSGIPEIASVEISSNGMTPVNTSADNGSLLEIVDEGDDDTSDVGPAFS